jgi:DnaJ-class molecular chaperone
MQHISDDLYETLQINHDANLTDIKKAYRKLALIYHPDKPDGNEEKFKQLSEAYHILSDTTKKAEYDRLFMYNMQSSDDLFTGTHRKHHKQSPDEYNKNKQEFFSKFVFSSKTNPFDIFSNFMGEIFNDKDMDFLHNNSQYMVKTVHLGNHLDLINDILNNVGKIGFMRTHFSNNINFINNIVQQFSSVINHNNFIEPSNIIYDIYVDLRLVYQDRLKKYSVKRLIYNHDQNTFTEEKIIVEVPLRNPIHKISNMGDYLHNWKCAGDIIFNIYINPSDKWYPLGSGNLLLYQPITSDNLCSESVIINLPDDDQISCTFDKSNIPLLFKLETFGLPIDDSDEGDLYIQYIPQGGKTIVNESAAEVNDKNSQLTNTHRLIPVNPMNLLKFHIN